MRLLIIPVLLAATLSAPAAQAQEGCRDVRVPRAEHAVTACLDDLTTTGTVASGHTDPADWAGLEAPGISTPSGVPGVQVDGYFPDTSTSNNTHGWRHDSQFVIRLPERWNGGLVVAGPPGVREQYANDRIISDQVLAKGYAYAATDKGNTGQEIYRDGRRPGDAILEWHRRVTELTIAAKKVAAHHYGRAPRTTYAAGLSAGGYLVHWQLENHPSLYTGGIAWNALNFTAKGPSLLTTLPPALRAYPRYSAGEPGAHARMLKAGYPAGSEPLWQYSHKTQWDFFQRAIREELDPGYDGAALAGTPFCAEGTGAGCDTDYRYATRPRSVHRAMAHVSTTGRIGRPLIDVSGTLDVLTPIARFGDVYDRQVAKAGRASLHRYHRIPGGTHTDGLVTLAPGTLRPMLPSFLSGFTELEAWTR